MSSPSSIWSQAQSHWASSTPTDHIEKTIDSFKMLKQRGVLVSPYSDISFWIPKPFEDFQTFVQSQLVKHQQVCTLKHSKLDADKVFENHEFLVLSPNTFPASQKYGRGTKWCISGKTQVHWDSYLSQNIRFYFVLSKLLGS